MSLAHAALCLGLVTIVSKGPLEVWLVGHRRIWTGVRRRAGGGVARVVDCLRRTETHAGSAAGQSISRMSTGPHGHVLGSYMCATVGRCLGMLDERPRDDDPCVSNVVWLCAGGRTRTIVSGCSAVVVVARCSRV